MASSVAVQHFRARNLVQFWDHDPDTASAAIVSPDAGTTKRSLDMKAIKRFVAIAKNTVLVGAGITKLEIVAASDSAMSADVTVVKDSGVVAVNDLNDWLIEECSAAEIAQLSAEAGLAVGAGLRYVAARLTLANSGDEACVIYIGVEPNFAYLNQTPATTTS